MRRYIMQMGFSIYCYLYLRAHKIVIMLVMLIIRKPIYIFWITSCLKVTIFSSPSWNSWSWNFKWRKKGWKKYILKKNCATSFIPRKNCYVQDMKQLSSLVISLKCNFILENSAFWLHFNLSFAVMQAVFHFSFYS